MAKIVTSVVIPTYNEQRDIPECLKSLEKQSDKNFEVIIVDDGSKDKTVEIVKGFKSVKILHQKHKGPGAARNLGASRAKGDFLIFVDADMTFDKNYVKNLIKPLQEDKSKKIPGTTHEEEFVKNVKNIWSRCWGKVRVSKKNAHKVRIFRSIRKSVFDKYGGFDPSLGYADDQTFWLKHNIKPVVARNTICYHKNPETLKSVYKQSRWIGASIENRYVNAALLKYFLPFLFILLAPITIPLLAVKRTIHQKDLLIFPAMILFMTARYFGTISGLVRKNFLKKNFR